MPIADDADAPGLPFGVRRLAQQVGEVDQEPRVVRIRIPRPFEIAHGAAIVAGAVVTALVRRRLERLLDRVRDEQRGTAGLAMDERRAHGGQEVLLRRDVRDGVVDEHRVEPSPQPKRSHVAFDVLALGVERAADREHLRRSVGERQLEAALHVRRVVAAAASQFQHGPHRASALFDQRALVERRLFGVLLGSGQQVEPAGQLAVEQGFDVRLVHGAPQYRPPSRPASQPGGVERRALRVAKPRGTIRRITPAA